METAEKSKRTLVFGVFDCLHAGHKFFLKEARERSGELVVVVTLPEVVYFLKKRWPKESMEDRVAKLRAFDPTLTIVPGDLTLGEWKILATHKPDRVLLGYDQQALGEELQKLNIPFEFLPPYEPDQYKTSLLF